MNTQQIAAEFSKRIHPSLVKALLEEYKHAKTAHGLSNTDATLNHGGQFCEVCIACMVNIADPNDGLNLNAIYFGIEFKKLQELPKLTAEDELFYTLIPTTLKSVWTLRSKKKAVHYKTNIADEIDAELVMTSCNWTMAQLMAAFHTKDPQEIAGILNSLMERKIPTIERFEDNKIMILKDLSFGDQLLLILYSTPKRMTVDELDALFKPKQRSYINTYLTRLFNQKLIHYDNSGAIINSNGVAEIEGNMSKYFNVTKL